MGIRSTILWIWKLIDPIYYFFSRLRYIDDKKNNPSLFRVRLTKYKGNSFMLADGTEILRNDLLLKIHLHNVRLLTEFFKIKNDLKKAKLMYKAVRSSMPSLANYLKNHPEEGKIKGIIGITTLNRGVKALGFECYTPVSRWYRFMKKLGQLPIFFLSNSSIKNLSKHRLTYLFISKDKLYAEYIESPLPASNKSDTVS